jgi:hypothetical protein
MELTEFFHKSIITTYSIFFKSSFETILLFVVEIANRCTLSAVEHDIVADTSYGILIRKCKVNCFATSINISIGSLSIVSHGGSEEMIVTEILRRVLLASGVALSSR